MIITRITIYMLLACNFTIHSLTKQPITMYCHGLGGSKYEVHGLLDHDIIHQPAKSIEFKKENDCGLGYGIDIEALKNNIDTNENYILYGISRGGATAINYLAEYNATNIQALVIDATPADIIYIVDELQYKAGVFILWTRAQKEWAVRLFFSQYPINSIPPVEAIAKITNKKLPVFIVHSHNDPVVNIRSAWHMYKAFKQANFENVYLCELSQGGHMSNASGTDSIIYKQALHSFYKLYGFQYDEQYAILKEKDLQLFQPDQQNIDDKISYNQNKLRKQGLINLGIYATAEQLLTTIAQ